jgi:acetylornithine/N-succinyldiaminopimelate aminotransferase
MEEYIKEAESLLMHTYSRYQIVLDRGEGVYLYDTNGKKYLDFGAGIAVFALGYGNREYNDTLKAQLDKLIHTSNYFYNVPSVKAASKFTKASGMDRVFFTNSGTEAIEGAIKLARKYYYKKHQRGDSQIIAMNRSFHGRSMGALSVTGQPSYREAFEPLIGGVVFADLNSIEDIKSKINDRTCAILLEPVQAEGGVYPAGEEYLKELKKLCEERDILLIFDEIQCGMGRCGSMFVWQEYGVKPDILTSAKALGCGVPVGAFGAVEKVCMAFEPGDHGTTYGGNPFTAAAVNAVFDQYEKLDLLNHVKEVSSYLEMRLDELVKSHKAIKERRGKGLLQGLEFEYPVKDIILKAMDNNLILFSAGSNVLRFVPPLVITREHVDEMIEILKKVIS